MSGKKCIVRIRGSKPFLSNKFDTTKHKNYKFLLDSDDKNRFDIEKYFNSIKKQNDLIVKMKDEVIYEKNYEEIYKEDIIKALDDFENLNF